MEPSRRNPVATSLLAPVVVEQVRIGLPDVLERVVRKIFEPAVAVDVSPKSKMRCQLLTQVPVQVVDQVIHASNVASVRPMRMSVGSATYCLLVSFAGATPPRRVR